MINNRQSTTGKGFTLIELMTAVSIFLVVMTISMGAILGIFSANDKVGSLKIVMDNLNFATETMSREIRFGTRYHCGSGDFTLPENCAGGADSISFLSNDGTQQIRYRLSGTSIEKSINAASPSAIYTSVTAPEINIQSLTFYVTGATLDNLQPRVVIMIKGSAGNKPSSQTEFTMQTAVSQRLLDNGL